ncbi:IS1-like element transposase [Mucilaginibacter sp. OK268]|uniref:IS1-like element transposase n=1 Tax=Mucilaginibacter sp. OK268 TaxID=1881048 RepID=UPI00115F988B
MSHYFKKAYKSGTNSYIINHVREGCGIRSIARLLNIPPNTVIRRIKNIASTITNLQLAQTGCMK